MHWDRHGPREECVLKVEKASRVRVEDVNGVCAPPGRDLLCQTAPSLHGAFSKGPPETSGFQIQKWASTARHKNHWTGRVCRRRNCCLSPGRVKGFSTLCGSRHPLGVLRHIRREQGGTSVTPRSAALPGLPSILLCVRRLLSQGCQDSLRSASMSSP